MSNTAKDDVFRVHLFGTEQFGAIQTDKYYDEFFDIFEKISERPFAFESVDFIKEG